MSKTSLKRKYLLPVVVCTLLLLGCVYYFFFTQMSRTSATEYVYIDKDDTADSVSAKLAPICRAHALSAFNTLVRHSGYASHVRPGRYAVRSGEGALQVFRHMKNGLQAPVHLTVPSVRTLDKLAAELSQRLMVDSATLAAAFTDEATCRKFGLDTATMACLFIPNTYDVYWNVSAEGLLERMDTERQRFWTSDRRAKAAQMKLSEEEVLTLASIVDEETANDDEKPMVAGMYYNRLMLRSAEYPQGMPLQADPTIKFAWKRFELKRIYRNLLTIDSPYNTYKNTGLPPGPIRIPTVAGIDAVLNYVKHDYLYMCAKEDFSGTHNFAATYAEHTANARRYAEALDRRGIK